MSRSDNTDPYLIRHKDKSAGYTNAERLVVGPKAIKWAKRYRSKVNRRRRTPVAKMSGFGYSYENYRYIFSD